MRSIEIWKKRYKDEAHLGSGSGSREVHLDFKTKFINYFIEDNNVESVLDYGHGDLKVASGIVVDSYTGIDIFEPSDIPSFGAKKHELINSRFDEVTCEKHDVVICLDVFYHILAWDSKEYEYLEKSIKSMYDHTKKYLIVYAQDSYRKDLNRYNSHMHNSPWRQIIDTDYNDLKCVYIQEPEFILENCDAQFFVYERISK